ncbi:MAG: hypothetical protein QM772_13410 [Ottowia sp.]|uniref:hypothetical protein n=1 Tax=Ottowia sp. TaxID=1898956 RepID=UPI0039E28EF6
MTEWHVGRALLHRWVWPLYAVYAGMAAGFALLGLAWLGAAVLASWWAAALMWIAGWLLFVVFAWGHLTGPCTDGGKGCEGSRWIHSQIGLQRPSIKRWQLFLE